MIRPFCSAVRALNSWAKSMMLTPAWPSAGPTGGAGVATPAGICSLICPTTFVAMADSLTWRVRPQPHGVLDLRKFLGHPEEIELDRRLPAEDRDHDLEGVAVEVDVLDDATEVVERAVDDLDPLALLVDILGFRLLFRRHDLLEDLIDLGLGQGRRVLAGADESGDLRSVLDDVPRIVRHHHLHQDVPG